MKTFALILFLATISATCFAQDKTDCSQFKTGKFQYIDSNKVVEVKRTKRIQEELVVNTGERSKHKITWVDDCIYDIKQVWTNRKQKRKMNGSVTRVQIISSANNSYNYSCTCKNEAAINKHKGTMFVVK